jgi:hypothetical protein
MQESKIAGLLNLSCSRTRSTGRGIPVLPASTDTTAKVLVAKRGRRNKNGVKPGWMLFRIATVLHAYDQARSSGDKRSGAIAAAVGAVRSQALEMPISETEVKRILAEFRSKNSGRTLIITKSVARGPELDLWFDNLKWIAEKSPRQLGAPHLPDYRSKPRQMRTLTIQRGPRPFHRRSNARS